MHCRLTLQTHACAATTGQGQAPTRRMSGDATDKFSS
jgi:hypothetical protein